MAGKKSPAKPANGEDRRTGIPPASDATISTPDYTYGRVIGPDGRRGVLLDPWPASNEKPVRVALENGEVVNVPGSALRGHSPGVYELAASPSQFGAPPSPAAHKESESAVIPVLAEEVHVERRPVPTGAVRVHRRVEAQEQTIDVPLHREHVDVRRILIGREVDGPLPVRREGEVTVIPIVEEVLVVTKKYVLKEEVRVTRTVAEERHRERVTTFSQHSEIERVDASGQPVRMDARVATSGEQPAAVAGVSSDRTNTAPEDRERIKKLPFER